MLCCEVNLTTALKFHPNGQESLMYSAVNCRSSSSGDTCSGSLSGYCGPVVIMHVAQKNIPMSDHRNEH